MIFDIGSIENIIGYTFNDKMLLRKCFTHSSYANEHGGENNELLEFFGDAILQFVVTEHLYKNSFGDEGKLTKKRADIVSREPLLKMVKKLGLTDFMLLGNGLNKHSLQDEKLYSSLYEALVAGIYLDGGIKSVQKFIKHTLLTEFDKLEKKQAKISDKDKGRDYKSLLQEYVQQYKLGSISYELLSKTGPDHKPQFRMAVMLNNGKISEGVGYSKKNAQMVGAEIALKNLQKKKKAKK